MSLAPLDDPAYEPANPPIYGWVPNVVTRWGARSQLRWFQRFWDELSLDQRQERVLSQFYCHSTQHKGPCCSSCLSEQEDGYYYTDDCCCRASGA